MKNVLVLFLFACAGLGLQAQDPVKDIKKAARLLGTYNLDPAGSADKLQEAVGLANASIDDALVKVDPTAWQVYGDIFMTVVNTDVAHFVLDPAYNVSDPLASGKAFKGFQMAAQLADKSYQTKDAMKALSAGIQNLYYMGSALYQTKNYAGAYAAFKATYDGYALLKKNNEPTNFDAAEQPKALYYSGLCAQQAGMIDEATVVYKQLVEEGNAEPGVYEALINIYKDSDPAISEKYLKAAREKYPDDTALLYAEINFLLEKGELVSLVSRLEKAIQADPKNVSVYVTLGQVYDKQFQNTQEDIKASMDSIATYKTKMKGAKNVIPFQDSIKAFENRIQKNNLLIDDYFSKAKSYYQKGLDLEPNNFDALYSLGALWYNKAAGYSLDLNLLADDYTPAGTKKYDAKKAEMDDAFVKALPFFQKAEAINADDMNTLIALKEIYARQNRLDLVKKYQEKIDNPALRGGASGEDFFSPNNFGFSDYKSDLWLATGTGFFIDGRGYISTNYHVVDGASQIEVDISSNGEILSYKAKVIKSDIQNDLAIIKIDDPKFTPFAKLPYNFKADVCEVGADVNVLGFPKALTGMGYEVKYTDGKISSKSGFNDDITSYQISAPVQGGSSGGPVWDDNGNIIGIVNAKIEFADNVTYAIKSSYLKNLVDALPNGLILPSDVTIKDKSLPDKIKIISPYVVLLKMR